MKLTIYTKTAGTIDVTLKEGSAVEFQKATDGHGAYVGDIMSIGETDAGPFYVSRDEVVAIGPAVDPLSA